MRKHDVILTRDGPFDGQSPGRLMAVRDGSGRLRRIDPASTVQGRQTPPAHDSLMRDLAALIALKKKH